MRRSLIILANSRKMRNRCIAGIDMQTDDWVRPCFGTGAEGVPWSVRKVDDAEPQLLDIVEIPLAAEGPHRDIQPENSKILDGAWKRVGKATFGQVAKYCQRAGTVLYNVDRRIHVTDLRKVAEEDRKSLCMVRANVNFSIGTSPQGRKRVFASFAYAHDQYRIPVTDYDFEHNFSASETREAECLLTVSLGSPYERDNYCYKFVAGVIEV